MPFRRNSNSMAGNSAFRGALAACGLHLQLRQLVADQGEVLSGPHGDVHELDAVYMELIGLGGLRPPGAEPR